MIVLASVTTPKMYGLSSRDSLSKIQTRWVTAVEETTKVIHVPPSKVSSEVIHLQEKVSELEKICHSLEERIAALESKSVPTDNTVPPEDCDHEPLLEEEEEFSTDP